MQHDTRPRFLLDVDGVCADFLGSALPVVERVTGTRYAPEDFPTWEIFDVIGREFEEACYAHFRAPEFCATIRPYAGAIEGVERLLAVADVHVVTSPVHGPHWYFERAEWVRRHLGVPPRDVAQKLHKETEFGHFLLDDRPRHVEAWAARHPTGTGLLWDQPYNRGEDGDMSAAPGNAHRVRSWDEVIAAVVQRSGARHEVSEQAAAVLLEALAALNYTAEQGDYALAECPVKAMLADAELHVSTDWRSMRDKHRAREQVAKLTGLLGLAVSIHEGQ